MMNEVVPIFVFCIAVGVVTSGVLYSGFALLMNDTPQRKMPYFSWNIMNLVLFLSTGALSMYVRAAQHGVSMQQRPSQGVLAILAAAVGIMWSFLLGVCVLNIYFRYIG